MEKKKLEITAKDLRTILNKRLLTQRRIIKVSNNEAIILHPSFLRKIGIIRKNEVETISIKCISQDNDTKELSLLEIEKILIDDQGYVKVLSKENIEYYFTCRNFYGEQEKVKLSQRKKSLSEQLTIEHNPSVAIVVHSKNLKSELDELQKFSRIFVEQNLNNNFQNLTVSKLSEKGIIERLLKAFNYKTIDQDKVKEQFINIYNSMDLELSSKIHNTSSIDLSSMQYLVKNHPDLFK